MLHIKGDCASDYSGISYPIIVIVAKVTYNQPLVNVLVTQAKYLQSKLDDPKNMYRSKAYLKGAQAIAKMKTIAEYGKNAYYNTENLPGSICYGGKVFNFCNNYLMLMSFPTSYQIYMSLPNSLSETELPRISSDDTMLTQLFRRTTKHLHIPDEDLKKIVSRFEDWFKRNKDVITPTPIIHKGERNVFCSREEQYMHTMDVIVTNYVGYNTRAIRIPYQKSPDDYEDVLLQGFILKSAFTDVIRREVHMMNIEWDDRLLDGFKDWYYNPDNKKMIINPNYKYGYCTKKYAVKLPMEKIAKLPRKNILSVSMVSVGTETRSFMVPRIVIDRIFINMSINKASPSLPSSPPFHYLYPKSKPEIVRNYLNSLPKMFIF